MHKLTNKFILHCPDGKHGDGAGLYFHKKGDSAKWVYRFTLYGKRREMGLGAYPFTSLKEARDKASSARTLVADGVDPINHRRHADEIARRKPTVEALFVETFEARKRQLKNSGASARWDSPLRIHIIPKIGHMNVEHVTQRDIESALRPIWHEKPETARKALSRLGLVLKHAAAAGLEVDLNATAKAQALLGAQEKSAKHVAAMPYDDVPAYFASLAHSPADLAMKFLILTGARSAEARHLHESELDGDIWTIPTIRMKGGIEHRVPLSDEAVAVIDEARKFSQNGFFFVANKGKPISDATLSVRMRRERQEARPHGFRTSLRTWIAEQTQAPREVAEACLAHLTGSKIERAYRRTDFLEKRRPLMNAWADFVVDEQSEKVVMLNGS